MDFADELDMMDDDCDIEGFPLSAICTCQIEITIGGYEHLSVNMDCPIHGQSGTRPRRLLHDQEPKP